jgi:hypothetical protein
VSTITLNQLLTFEVVECYSCATSFALTEQFIRNRCDDHKGFYCPNGHLQSFQGKSEAERLRDQLAQRERSLEFARQRQRDLERSRSAFQAVATRRANELKRVKSGVCPCCNRSFTALGRHMATKHPDYRPVEQVEAVASVVIPDETS